MGLQQQGQLPLLGRTEEQGLPPLTAPDAAVPEEQPLSTRVELLPLVWEVGSGRDCHWRGRLSGLSTGLRPGEQVPELDPQPRATAISGKEHGHALGAAASHRVGMTPKGRHRCQGSNESGGQGLGATSLQKRLADLAAQPVATGLVGGPGGRPVRVVELRQVLEQGRTGLTRSFGCGWLRFGCGCHGIHTSGWRGAGGWRWNAAAPMRGERRWCWRPCC